MIVKIDHPIYGKTELNVERIIAICPQKNRVLFENVGWSLDIQDFRRVADAWRNLYDR